MFDDLAKKLRSAGVKVQEVPGWQKNRQADRRWTPKFVVLHHTAGVGEGLASFISRGTPSVRGPLSQFLVKRDGTVVLISAGRANHAGLGGPWKGVPKDSMNSYGWGIEVESRGITPDWTPVQWTAVHRLTAVLLKMMGEGTDHVLRHRDWANGRKVDTRYPLTQHRRAVQVELDRLANLGKPKPKPKPKPAPKPVPPRAPSHSVAVEVSNVQPGDRGGDVAVVQWALMSLGFDIPLLRTKKAKYGENFGEQTKAAYRRYQLHLGYRGSDADGEPGFASLSALGKRTGLFKAVNK